MSASIETVPVKPTITVDDLDKIDVRVGRIVAVDDVEGSRPVLWRARCPRA